MKLNNNNTRDFEIIAKYLSGEMSNVEVSQFEKQLEIFPENKIFVDEMKQKWEKIGNYQKTKEVDVNKGWQALYGRLDGEQLIPENKFVEHKLAPVWVKWAASIVVLLTIVSITFYSLQKDNTNLLSLQTGNESKTLIQTLTDGSVVYLANNTTLSYPEKFSKDERKVNLKGEAFFDITPNPKKPFRIETDQVIVEVLGTAFNVKSENGNLFELAVERGKVRVTLKSNPSQSQIVLPGEKISTTDHQLVKSINDNRNYFSWRTHRMQFKDESLSNIVKVINKNYRTNIRLNSLDLGDRKLTVTFDNNSLNKIIELICLAHNLEQEVKSDSTIIIKPVEK